MRACLACLLGLASALKIQKLVDASFRQMAAAGLQPVPQANLRAEERSSLVLVVLVLDLAGRAALVCANPGLFTVM